MPLRIQLRLVRLVQLQGLLGQQGPILLTTGRARWIVVMIQMNVRLDQHERCRSRNVPRQLTPMNRQLNLLRLPRLSDRPPLSNRRRIVQPGLQE